MTIPITVPRSSSRASVAANGMSSCAPTEVTPTTTSAIAMTGSDGAAAVHVNASAATTSTRGTYRRRSTMSPSGTSATIPNR